MLQAARESQNVDNQITCIYEASNRQSLERDAKVVHYLNLIVYTMAHKDNLAFRVFAGEIAEEVNNRFFNNFRGEPSCISE